MSDSDHCTGGTEQEIVVEFTQRFTVKPPAEIDDPVYAEDWFWNIYSEIGWDVLDPKRKDHYEVVEVRSLRAGTDRTEGDR